MEDRMKLAGRVALVVGGASGLGRASSEACAEDGAKVLIADINKAGGEAVAAAIRAKGGTASFVKTDATSEDAIKAAVEAAVREFGKLDILVNSAGLRDPDVPMDWHASIDLFLKGPYYACLHGVPEIKRAGGGAIINISSLAGITGGVQKTVEATGYPCAKHGLVGLTRTLALAYAKDNIRVNAVCPGYIKTGMTQDMHQANDGGQSLISETLRVPMDRWGEPHEIGRVVAFLASNDASFITGQPIVVDGGFMAR
jgi:NAD(P)-dependent dehydrogenase (short-subunit alcohol dehydrogenase family)